MSIRKLKFISALLAIQLFTPLHAETIGIIGGTGVGGLAGDAYAALVLSDNTVSPLPVVLTGPIQSVAIGFSGIGIIGGREFAVPNPYAAFVLANGQLVPLNLSFPGTGRIDGVAINNTGTGLIGGQSGTALYAALVTPDGSVTSISPLPATGSITSTSINDSELGLIGGRDTVSGDAFVAYTRGAVASQVVFSPAINGLINEVAINSSGMGVYGGSDAGTNVAHAGLVFSDGSYELLSLNLSPDNSEIRSVAINDLGEAIIGGANFTAGNSYAAYITSTRTLIPIAGLPDGNINGVDINSSGVGIIGGQYSAFVPFAAFVYSDGTFLPINGLLPAGLIYDVSINTAGVGLLGGEDGSGNHYASLVAPNGTVTPNILTSVTEIFSVDLIKLLDAAAPSSIGPYSSALNSVLSTSNALNAHIMVHHKRRGDDENLTARTDLAALVADAAFGEKIDAGDGLAMTRQGKKTQPAQAEVPPETCIPETPAAIPCCKTGHYTAFAVPFYDHIHQKADKDVPAFTNDIGGVLAAFEYMTVNDAVFGGGLSYAFNYVHYSDRFGHADINTEMGVIYSSFNWDHFFLNATLWGGLYQLDNERHSPPLPITSTLKTDGWVLSPHVELSYTFGNACKWFFTEPFGMVDWANSWQSHATEKGSSGLNLVLDSTYASLLRSELGFRFYEVLRYQWGRILITEKASYINRTPFHFNPTNTFFVGGSASSFSVTTGSNSSQNLAGLELNFSFQPCNEKYPYVSIDAQGEFGASFQSYFVGLEVGKKF